jgi:hypothetical protein
MADTPYVDPFPPVLQPPDDQPFTDVIAMRVGAARSARAMYCRTVSSRCHTNERFI